jgi:hypothetical protein
MELSLSREATICAATQEFPNILWNTKVYYHVPKSPSLVPILSRIHPVLSKIHFIIILSSTSRSS